MTNRGTVLVSGATGLQGGSVARALLSAGYVVRALTRNPEGPAAQRLTAEGATIVAGSFDEPGSVRRAADGADAMFLMGNFFEAGPAGETRQGIAAADAAKAAGVRHLIYSSVADANKATGIPHFESKYRVEQHIAALGINHTIVAPVAFMEGLVAPWSIEGLRQGVLAAALPPECRNQFIAVADIGAFVVALLNRNEKVFGARFDIAGDALSGVETSAILTRATGRPIHYQEIPMAMLREQNAEAAIMFEWFNRVGYDVDIPALRQDFPEVAWTRLEDWAARFKWSVLDRVLETAG